MTYTFVPCDPVEQRDEILTLWRSTFGDVPAKRFSWIYTKHPAGTPLCWLARDAADRVVGFGAVIPREFSFGAQRLLGGITADFCVAEGHRGLGPALRLHRSIVADAFEKGFDFLYGLPNPHSAPVQARIGFRPVGRLTSATCILRSQHKLEEKLSPRLAAFASPVVDFALLSALAVRGLSTSRRHVKVDFIHEFDTRVDALHTATSTAGTFLGVRDEQFLNWRFKASPYANYEVFQLVDNRSRRCAGYIVFHVADGRVHVDDILCEPALCSALMYEFVRMQRRRGYEAVSITCLVPDSFEGALRRTGFRVRKGAAASLHVLPNPASKRGQAASNLDAWWLFSADHDV